MLSYYAFYARADRKLVQVHITMAPGKFSERTEIETGVVYKTNREAMADMVRLNCGGAA
jgi:hypothetical protein